MKSAQKPNNSENSNLNSSVVTPEVTAKSALASAEAALNSLLNEKESLAAKVFDAIKQADAEGLLELRARQSGIDREIWVAKIEALKSRIALHDAVEQTLSREWTDSFNEIESAKEERQRLINEGSSLVAQGRPTYEARECYDLAHAVWGKAQGRHETARQNFYNHSAKRSELTSELDQLLKNDLSSSHFERN